MRIGGVCSLPHLCTIGYAIKVAIGEVRIGTIPVNLRIVVKPVVVGVDGLIVLNRHKCTHAERDRRRIDLRESAPRKRGVGDHEAGRKLKRENGGRLARHDAVRYGKYIGDSFLQPTDHDGVGEAFVEHGARKRHLRAAAGIGRRAGQDAAGSPGQVGREVHERAVLHRERRRAEVLHAVHPLRSGGVDRAARKRHRLRRRGVQQPAEVLHAGVGCADIDVLERRGGRHGELWQITSQEERRLRVGLGGQQDVEVFEQRA